MFRFYVCFTRWSDGKLDAIGPFQWDAATLFAELWRRPIAGVDCYRYSDTHIRWRE